MITYFGSQLSPNKVETAEGFLICRNVPIARTGDQIYLARELQLDGDPDRQVNVHRYPEEVFDRATVASFEGKPVTDTHPSEFVDPDNFQDLAKGHVQNVRKDGEYIVADLYINDSGLIEKIKNGTKEVSCGYVCTYEPDGEDYKQTHIRGNHVAVVQYGRAGHEVAIKDAAAKTAEKGTLMSKFKGILAAFGMAAKDAEPEEIKALAELTSMALDAQEAEPAKEEEKAPEAEPAKEEEKKEEPAEEKAKDEEPSTIEKKLDMLIALLTKKAEATDESEVIEEEEEVAKDEACESEEAKDFMSILSPAINGISNKKERARVSQAILKAVSTDSMKSILAAAGSSAKKTGDAATKTSYEKACAESQAAYAARNPHTKKEA